MKKKPHGPGEIPADFLIPSNCYQLRLTLWPILLSFTRHANETTNARNEKMIKTLNEAIEIAAATFAAESACVEVEIAMFFGPIWIGRDLQVFDHPRFAN